MGPRRAGLAQIDATNTAVAKREIEKCNRGKELIIHDLPGLDK